MGFWETGKYDGNGSPAHGINSAKSLYEALQPTTPIRQTL